MEKEDIAMTIPNVFMVTKPMAPPWDDSSKKLARDIAVHAGGTAFRVMSVSGHSFSARHITAEPVYASSGDYAPGRGQNLRVFLRLLRRDSDVDVYHFFFAPNPITSNVLKWLMKPKRRKTVHTICSGPRSYAGVKNLVFADRVVALSEDTREKLCAAGVPNVIYIPPGIDLAETTKVKKGNPHTPFKKEGEFSVLFSGDYEYSGAHMTVIRSLARLFVQCPQAKLYFACRRKTPAAAALELSAQEEVEKSGFGARVQFLEEVPSMMHLIQAMDLCVFPAASLYRKMDLPLVLIEALANGVPLVVSDLPSLKILGEGGAAEVIPAQDPEALARAVAHLGQDAGLRRRMAENGRRLVAEKFDIRAVAARYETLYRELIQGDSA
jgi:phosphatidylinositol alpha-1,6-mannosyltransferase